MKKYYDAARALNMSDKKIKEEFDRRGQKSLYKLIKKNKFKPFEITKGMQEAYEYQSKKYGIPDVLDSATIMDWLRYEYIRHIESEKEDNDDDSDEDNDDDGSDEDNDYDE